MWQEEGGGLLRPASGFAFVQQQIPRSTKLKKVGGQDPNGENLHSLVQSTGKHLTSPAKRWEDTFAVLGEAGWSLGFGRIRIRGRFSRRTESCREGCVF